MTSHSDMRYLGIAGAGGDSKGGGDSSGTGAKEAPDTLQSRATARVVDLIGEGEIEGLVNGHKSIYLQDTPLQADDDTYNFKGVSVATRSGTQTQEPIAGFSEQESETAVSVEVTNATPVVRAVTNVDADAVRVTLAVQGLSQQDTTNGDLNGYSVTVAIDIQADGGSYVAQGIGADGSATDTITGKTRSHYQRSYRIPLRGTGPWNVRVRRISGDSVSSAIVDKTYWDSFTEITEAKLSYPNCALVALAVDATQFNQIPVRTYHMKLMRVKVPSNYDPVTRLYTGVWDGTFVVAYTNNPAWCFYDLVTTTRYGLGDYIPAALVDKWALYTIGRYCDGLVSDGKGGMEPRFTLNVQLITREEAFKVLNDLASVFRGMIYWSAGTLYTTQDAPTDVSAIFNRSNVVDGQFIREGTARSARHTAALVTWRDPSRLFRPVIEYVPDPAGIARYGLRKIEVSALGCTSQGQAHRVGKWILYTERYETDVISWRAGQDAAFVRPGAIVKVMDPTRSTYRWGGRIVAASANSATIDAPVTLEPAVEYSLSFIQSDGTEVTRVLTNPAGTTSIMVFSEALADTDIVQAVWVISSAALEPEKVRIISVVEDSGSTYKITGVQHYEAKFDAIETGISLQTPNTSNLQAAPGRVTNLAGSEYLYKAGGAVRVRLVINFSAGAAAVRYAVAYRRAQGNWIPLHPSADTHYEVDDVVPDTYELKVSSVSGAGKQSQPTRAEYTVLGKAGLPPANVTGFTSVNYPTFKQLKWVEVPDLDLDSYEIRDGADWASGVVVISGYSGTTKDVGALAVGNHLLWIAAKDTSGNYSAVPASTTVTVNALGTPTVTHSFVGQDSLTSWSAPSSDFAIDRYEIREGASWSTAAPVTTTKGTSYRQKATWSGSKTLLIAAIDIAGNVGPAGSITITVNLLGAPTVTGQVIGTDFLLSWVPGSGSLPNDQFELKYGADFATGTSLGIFRSTTFNARVTWGGSRSFFVAGIDTAGNYGASGSTAINITSPSAPTLTNEVIDNNVNLSWSDGTATLPIEHYLLYRGDVYATAELRGDIKARFWSFFEKSQNTYTYWVAGVDTAGNVGSPAGLSVFVNQPPDYVLYDDQDSELDSTSVTNVVRYGGLHYALTLDGVNQHAMVASIPDLDASVTALSFEAWILSTDLTQNQGLVEKTVGGTVNTCANLYISGGNVVMKVLIGGVAKTASASLAAYVNKQAIHVIGRWDGTNVKIVVQGVNVASTSASGALDQGAGALYIGRLATTGYYAKGGLGPVRVYKRYLNDTEILEHYRGIFKSETSLVGAWDHSEGAGDTVKDDSDNANDLVLVNSPTFVVTDLDGRYDNHTGLPAQILFPLDQTQTFDEKFNTGGRATPQDNITAGYPAYTEPAGTTGPYVEVVDFGLVIPATLVTAQLTSSAMAGSVTITPTISVKEHWSDPWTDYAGVWSTFATSFRYVKVTLAFSGAGGANYSSATRLNIRLDVKIKSDSGMGSAVSTDVGGTVVTFNVAFADVRSLGVTAQSTSPVFANYDFVDAPYPTTFKVLLFDRATGARVSGPFSWNAEGV